MLFITVIFVVFMCLWFAGGLYYVDRANPGPSGANFLAWACVLLLGLVVFGAVGPGPGAAIQVNQVR